MAKMVIVFPVLVVVITVINLCSSNQPDYCRLPPVTGVCRAYLPRFYYNSRSGRCESFVYGGCRGNANRFMTVRACTAACGITRSNVCSLPKVVGRCRAAMRRFYFNQRSGRCEQFIYGGCHGNANNFRLLSRCQRRCPSSYSYSRFRREATSQITPQECRQPPQPGPCEAYIPSFYFNSSTSTCNSFVYGGCQGNANRFPSEEQCMRACGSTGLGGSIIGGGLQSSNPYSGRGNNPSTSIYPQVSLWETRLLPFFRKLAEHFSLRDSGSRKEGIGQILLPETSPVPRRRNTTNTPEISKVSSNESLGLSGTHTRPTLAIDFPFGKHVCQLPKDPGFCYAAFTMFFYNKTADTCESFIYGGCQGNGNRFESKEWCEMTCKTTTMPTFDQNDCLLPRKTGRCRAYFKRFYFNAASGRCEEFVYGGCHGNNNRFETLRECHGKCRGVRRTS